jgi:UV excision repair protein RAD23
MKIIIKTLKNQQLPMEVEESTKLSELKQMI